MRTSLRSSLNGERTRLLSATAAASSSSWIDAPPRRRRRGSGRCLYQGPLESRSSTSSTVTFLQTQPRPAGGPDPALHAQHHRRGGLPATRRPHLLTVRIDGPVRAEPASGDTPSRQQDLRLPSRDAPRTNCRAPSKILSTLARRAYRRPLTDSDLEAPPQFLPAPAADNTAASKRASRLALQPHPGRARNSCSASSPTRPTSPPAALPHQRLELASRLSFFLWSSIPDDRTARPGQPGQLTNPRCSSSR